MFSNPNDGFGFSFKGAAGLEEGPTDCKVSEHGISLSMEVYACPRDTQDLVTSQIINWANIERYNLDDLCTHSVVFTSLDKRRIYHAVGWRDKGPKLNRHFDDFRHRGSGKDGAPSALKESTHMYDTVMSYPAGHITDFSSTIAPTYPLFSLDIYTTKRKESFNDITQKLSEAIESLKGTQVEGSLVGMHLLKSNDALSCIVMGSWTCLYGYEDLNPSNTPEYCRLIEEVKELACEGTYSDMIEKTSPRRMYNVENCLRY
jgi:hypothetical protein